MNEKEHKERHRQLAEHPDWTNAMHAQARGITPGAWRKWRQSEARCTTPLQPGEAPRPPEWSDMMALARRAGYAPSKRTRLLWWRRYPPLVYLLRLGSIPPKLAWTAPSTAPEAKLREDPMAEMAHLVKHGLDVRLDEPRAAR